MSIAFLFPGQGSQKVNMLADFTEQYPQILTTFSEASDALGFDVWQLCADKDKLAQTAYTQPALLTASIALWRLWLALGGRKPALLAGHSLGEYSALVASGVLSLTDGVKLVHARGQYMQEAVTSHPTGMAAVLGKSMAEVAGYCQQAIDTLPSELPDLMANNDSNTPQQVILSPANDNCTGQVVVSGHALAIDALMALAKTEKFKVIKLAVSVPSHCALMQPAATQLQALLDEIDFSQPQIPVIQNRHASIATDTHAIKTALIEQLSLPVLWRDSMQLMAEHPIKTAFECGVGKTLVGLLKREKLDLTAQTLGSVADFESALSA